ncbi:MAG: class I SAM-dependent methyltransferase [Candidatus Eremiobacteraeota bacterium]|nr:class I SAM-dependent methyltransferase [Candidatus Eremiobacteraeota bacterium]
MIDLSTIPTRTELLAAIGETLSGGGVEFGAGANPFPVGPSAKVRYADRNSADELHDRAYFGEAGLVPDDIRADFEAMEGLPPDSLDFIIASHVIEHTSNPLRALESAHSRLRIGGRLVLVVPDKNVTFDKDRAVTTLEHLLADYTRPSRERDWEHYIEFFAKCFPQPDPVKAAEPVFALGHDIHFHVWTFESFGDLIAYARRQIAPWSAVWSRPRISDQENEFYFVLTK